MTANIITITGLVLFVIVLVASTYRWGTREALDQYTYPREFLVGLGRGMGLDRYTERTFFGERIQVLAGTFGRLEVELEISSGENWEPYVRVTVDFPKPLAQDVGVYSGDRQPLGSHVRRLDEVELGDESFDEQFVLIGRDPERVELMLPDATRYQLTRLNGLVDDVQLTDQSLFLFLGENPDRAMIKTILKKAVELGDRSYRTARTLGPRTPERGVGHYEKATTETELRVSAADNTSVEERPGAE